MKKIFDKYIRKYRSSRRYTTILVILSLLVIIGVNWGLHGNGISVTENEFYDGQGERAEISPEITQDTDSFSDGDSQAPSDDLTGKDITGADQQENNGTDENTPSGSEDLNPGINTGTNQDVDNNTNPDTDGNTQPDTDNNIQPDTDDNAQPDTDGNIQPDTDDNTQSNTDKTDEEETSGKENEKLQNILGNLTGNWPRDLADIADAQIGDKEPAGGFVVFCLQSAQIPQETIPRYSDAQSMHSAMSDSPLFVEKSGEIASNGDIVGYVDEQNNQDLGIVLGTDGSQGTLKVASADANGEISEHSIAIQEALFTISVNTAWQNANAGLSDSSSENNDSADPSENDTSTEEPKDTIENDSENKSENTAGEGSGNESGDETEDITEDVSNDTTESPSDNPEGNPSDNPEGSPSDNPEESSSDNPEESPSDNSGEGPSDDSEENSSDDTDDSSDNVSNEIQGNTQLQLSDYITSITFEKIQDGSWVPVKDMIVDNHEQIRLKLNYHMPAGTVNSSQDEVHYQLPGGIKLSNALNGNIKDSQDNTIGTFTISEDGKVVLSFLDNFADGQAFDGYFQFQAKAEFSESEENGQVKFGTSGTLTIRRNEDISVTKGVGNLVGDAAGNSYIDYTITVSTTNGTGNTVTITDCLNKTNGAVNDKILTQYVIDTIIVKKTDAAGKSTILSETDYHMTVDTVTPQIIIDGLPSLEAGEKYQLCYRVKITPDQFKGSDGSGNGYGLVYNYVKAESGNISGEKYDKVTYSARISKSGTYDSHTGLITWTIVTNNPNPQSDFNGYILKDILPEGVEIRGDVVVTTSAGTTFTITGEQLLKGYEYKNFLSKQYTFTFKTTVPDNFSEGNYAVTNRAEITKGDSSFSASGTVNIPVGRWGIQKNYEGKETDSDGVTRAYWNVQVTNSTGGRKLVFKDSFRDAVDDNHNTLNDSHYGIASELQNAIENGLTLTHTDGSQTGYAAVRDCITVTYYDKDGNEIPASDGSTHVKNFTITVDLNTEGAENIKAIRYFSLNHYPSRADLTAIDMGRTAEYENHAAIWENGKINVEDSAEFTHKNMNRLDKKVSTNGGKTYTDGGTVDYANVKDASLYYQLEIQTEAEEKEEIVLHDVLPEHIKRSSVMEFYLDGNRNDKIGTFRFDEDTGVYTFTVKNYNTDNRSHSITIKYGVKIGEKWKDLSTVRVDYTNSVTWGKNTVSTTTTVQRQPEKIQKYGVQITENGKKTNRIRYTVVLNPSGATLHNGTEMTLTDTMTVSSGSSIAVDLSSIVLYYYDYDYENGNIKPTQEVDHGLYQILPPQEGESIRVIIPDKTACILVYECIVDPGNVYQPTVKNTACLAGAWPSQIQNKVEQATASAGAGNGKFILTKTDSYNGKVLEGAKFTIYCYDNTKRTWKSLGEKNTVNGTLEMTITRNGVNTLNANKLYKIVESEAPPNYTLDATPRYYIWRTADETEDAAYLTATGLANVTDTLTIEEGETIGKGDIAFNDSNSRTTVSVPNSYSKLTVNKLWMDEQNRPLSEAPVQEIKVQLYRYTTNPADRESVGGAVELNSSNNWSYTWEGENIVPKQDENGQDYHYIIEEVNPESNWNVTYRNNGGIQTGEITIVNVVSNTYELPETGSTGTAPYTAAGLILIFASMAVYGYRKSKQ